jgi:hypothetical protein
MKKLKTLLFRTKYALGFIKPEVDTFTEDRDRMAVYICKTYSPANRVKLLAELKQVIESDMHAEAKDLAGRFNEAYEAYKVLTNE